MITLPNQLHGYPNQSYRYDDASQHELRRFHIRSCDYNAREC